MASSTPSTRLCAAMEKTSQWVLSQDIPSDIIVQVGDDTFRLHKFMLVANSGYIRRKVMESERANLGCIDLSDMPGGAEVFEKAAKFCYGMNFEISVHNVAALRCAAEYLQMTEDYSRGNLAERAEEFINQAAVKTLPGAVALLRSCEGSLLPVAEEVRIVQRSVDAISLKAFNEANNPTRSPPDWWASELAALAPASLQKILSAMKSRGAAPKSLAAAVVVYAEKSLAELLPLSSGAPASNHSGDARIRQCGLLESLVHVLPPHPDAPSPSVLSVASSGRPLRRSLRGLPAGTRAAGLRFSRAGDSRRPPHCFSGLFRRANRGSGQRTADRDKLCGKGGWWRGWGALRRRWRRRLLLGGGSESCAHGGRLRRGDRDGRGALGIQVRGYCGSSPKSARRFDDDLYRAVDIYLKVYI
ncbi:unnamed protein product, partial [Musa acuminata subsp. burmannicoides]